MIKAFFISFKLKLSLCLAFICLLCFTCSFLYAQDNVGQWRLKIVDVSNQNVQINTQSYKDLLAVQEALNNSIFDMHKKGYLASNIDSIVYNKDTAIAYIYKGEAYKWGKLGLEAIPKGMLNQIGIAASQYEGKVLEPKKLALLMKKMIVNAENNGYPFAQVSFSDVKLNKDNTFDANLIYKPGPLIKIDTIEVRGNATVDYQFVLSYLGLKNKQFYNESSIKSISKKIKELPFLQEGQPWVMNFTVLHNNLYLYLDEKKSNQVNALIGFQPNNLETKRFLWTADIQMLLNNTLGYGETFSASYKNLQAKSPQLDIAGIVPYIMGSKIALDGKFEYFKRDSLFDRITFEGGIRYQFSEKDYFRISYQQFTNRVPSPDTSFVKLNKRLSNNVDLSSRGVGANYVMDKTDFSLNPRTGWTASLNVSVLRRTIKKNDLILSLNDGFDYNQLYDTVNNKPTQYRLSGHFYYFIPLAKQLAVKIGYDGAYIGGNDLFQNELYQIGGFKVLRGFDERSIFANHYHIGTLELKTLLGQRSYFSIFSDYGRFFTQYNLVNLQRSALSFGAGLALENKTGIFNIIVALGKFDNEPLAFRNAKVHFGYVTYF